MNSLRAPHTPVDNLPTHARLGLRVLLAWLVVAGPLAFPAAGQSEEAKVDFNRDVRPILSDRCFVCHGPDAQRREADLRLDIRSEAALEALAPGSPEASELVRRIESSDPDERMPPAASKLVLTAQERKTLRAWVAQGATWNTHWAFTPPQRHETPKVREAGWVRDDLDGFVLARIERAGLRPANEAEKATLVRRLSFDIRGLPPTLEEINTFLADEQAGAYERLVDRMLESPAYGERMASVWLDAARYSDTYGYQVDRDRFVWPWRDWVIRAFNENKPFDQFAIEQIAGDLLDNATPDQILATTFNRLHPQKVEGGSVPEEFRVEYVADRTQTFATAFLGLTMECARCHSHKYDPISQTEYFKLFAFFNNIDEAGLYSYFTPSIPTPTLSLVNQEQEQSLQALRVAVEAAERAYQTACTSDDAFQTWLAAQSGNWNAQKLAEHTGQIAYLDFENPPGGANQHIEGVAGKGYRLSGDHGVDAKAGNFRRSQPFAVSLWMRTPDLKDRAVIFHRSRAWTDAGSRGYQLLLEDGRLSASLIHFWPGNAIRVRAKNPVPLGQWIHVAVTYDGSSRAAGLRIYVQGRRAAVDVVRDRLTKNITGGGGDTIRIGERFRDRGFQGGDVDEFRVYNRELTELEVRQEYDGKSLLTALDDGKTLAAPDQAALRQFYLSLISKPAREAAASLQGARENLNKRLDGLQEIMVMQEMPQRRPTYRLARGAYDAPREKVQPGSPAVLPPLPEGELDRLTLARWLVSPDHPLTARVAVNRLWQICFGEGLVRTPEDFGSQGQPPSHPLLLDRLAYDFAHTGWDVKQMLKRIVMSATYRQASTPRDASVFARDPENRLLARSPKFRLPAEMIRDNALAASGLLASQQGGPPARPYDLALSFKPTNPDKGQGLYRRSVYTYWKRTAPAPVMMTLDASKREVCRVKRERTISPLQALVVLNGPQFVEASRVLAEKLLLGRPDNPPDAIPEMFQRLTSRQPSQEELDVLVGLYERQHEYFATREKQAIDYLQVGAAPRNPKLDPAALASLAVVANTLLNYDGCLMRN